MGKSNPKDGGFSGFFMAHRKKMFDPSHQRPKQGYTITLHHFHKTALRA
jgi:hypothetical protein